VDSGTRSSLLHAPKRTAWRILATTIAGAVVLGLTPSVATAAPKRPTDSQIQDARQKADALSKRITAFAGQISSAQAEVECLISFPLERDRMQALDQIQASGEGVQICFLAKARRTE